MRKTTHATVYSYYDICMNVRACVSYFDKYNNSIFSYGLAHVLINNWLFFSPDCSEWRIIIIHIIFNGKCKL